MKKYLISVENEHIQATGTLELGEYLTCNKANWRADFEVAIKNQNQPAKSIVCSLELWKALFLNLPLGTNGGIVKKLNNADNCCIFGVKANGSCWVNENHENQYQELVKHIESLHSASSVSSSLVDSDQLDLFN